MQEFKKPWIAICKEFTVSELAMMSWSSREQSASLRRDMPDVKHNLTAEEFLEKGMGNPTAEEDVYNEFSEKRGPVEEMPGDDVDLRKFKGKDLWRYFNSQGLNFPMIVKDRSEQQEE